MSTLREHLEAMSDDERAARQAWVERQVAKAPPLDEATARRISAALFGTTEPKPIFTERERDDYQNGKLVRGEP